jgi:anti-sigma factor RsiW
MDCSAFKKRHSQYVDDVLTGEQAEAMWAHMQVCADCAAHDARIRRAMFLVRNVGRVEPRRDFSERLQRRLEFERKRQPVAMAAGPGVRSFSIAAAAIVVVGALVTGIANGTWRESSPPRLPAVVAFPQATLDSTTAPAVVAAMSAGMAVWPALWIAEEAPIRYASSMPYASNASMERR